MKPFLILLISLLPWTAVWAQTQTPPGPVSGYTYRVEAGTGGKEVYVCGQRPYDAAGNLVGAGDLTAQTRQVFDNLKKALSYLGLTLSNVTQITYLLKGADGVVNTNTERQVNSVGSTYLPAGITRISTTKSISKVGRDDVLLEIEVVAVK